MFLARGDNLRLKRCFGFLPGFPWAVEGLTNAATTSSMVVAVPVRVITTWSNGRLVRDELIFYFQGLAEHGSNDPLVYWELFPQSFQRFEL